MSSTTFLRKPRGAASLLIIILLIMIIIALIVWYAFWGKPGSIPSPSASVSASPTDTKAVSIYDGWKSYALIYEKFSLKYPSDWTLKDSSSVDANIGGMDKVTISSPDGFDISIRTNVWGIGGSCEDCKAFETTYATILGAKTGVSIFGTAKGASGIGLMRADLSGTTEYECIGLCTIPGKNVANKLNSNQPGLTMVTGGYSVGEAEAVKLGSNNKYFTYDELKKDTNIATARYIFESFSY